MSGFGAARSARASGERSTGQCGAASSARRMQARQKVCAHVRVVHGSTNGALHVCATSFRFRFRFRIVHTVVTIGRGRQGEVSVRRVRGRAGETRLYWQMQHTWCVRGGIGWGQRSARGADKGRTRFGFTSSA
jgi:hypothetical protein